MIYDRQGKLWSTADVQPQKGHINEDPIPLSSLLQPLASLSRLWNPITGPFSIKGFLHRGIGLVIAFHGET